MTSFHILFPLSEEYGSYHFPTTHHISRRYSDSRPSALTLLDVVTDYELPERAFFKNSKLLVLEPTNWAENFWGTCTDRKNLTNFLYLVLRLACKVTCYFWLFSLVLVSVLRTSINVLSKSKSRYYVTWIANLTKLFLSVKAASAYYHPVHPVHTAE